MDVVTADHARIAEEAGAVAVMALERVPSDIRKYGGVARMSDPRLIEEIKAAVTIPVMAKCRIGHFVEAQILQSLEVDYIDESEVLTPADEAHHIDKHQFAVPFVCGCRDLGEALRRIGEGAAMIRTKGEAGTGNIVEAVRHMRAVRSGIRPAALDAPGRAVRGRQGAARPARGRPPGRRAGRAAGSELQRRWRRHPGRRGPHAPAGRARPCSWGAASSRPRTPRRWPRPSSWRPRITTTPRSWRRSVPVWVSRCAAWNWRRSPIRSGWPRGGW